MNTTLKKRFRDFGFKVGVLAPGPMNSITDVPGVTVGHLTKIEGDDIRTGITIIDPGVSGLFIKKIPCAISVGNGSGKLAGITQVEEFGTLETSIALTNTLAVGPIMRGVIDIVLKENPALPFATTINVIVGETNDGRLNAIHRNVIREDDVVRAYEARSSICEEGNVGAGTGTRAFSWKGGIGTASRSIPFKGKNFTLGVLVQTNYGGSLVIRGVPVGEILGKNDFDVPQGNKVDGSCMIVLGTNAPVTARQLKRIAKRTFWGLVRTGSIMATSSGDYAIGFTTSRAGIEGTDSPQQLITDDDLNLFFLAAIEATEEAVYNALFTAETLCGRGGNCLTAFPKDIVIPILQKYSDLLQLGI